MITEKKIGYFAGILDGEGCIMICKRMVHTRPEYILHVQVTNTNHDLLLFLQKDFGGTIQLTQLRMGHLPLYTLNWHGSAAKLPLKLIYDDLIIKKEKAEIFLNFPINPPEQRGKPFSPQEKEQREMLYQQFRNVKAGQPVKLSEESIQI